MDNSASTLHLRLPESLQELGSDNRRILVSMLLWGLAEGLWFYTYPIYIKTLGANPAQIGLVISLGLVGQTLSFIPGGILADRYSRKKVMVAGSFLGITALLILALAHDWRQVIPALVLYNATAFISPAVNSYVAHATKTSKLNLAYTLINAAYFAGFTISPTFGGWMGQELGMRTVFALATALVALTGLALLPLREQPVHPHATSLSLRPLLSNRSFVSLALVSALIYFAIHIGWPLTPNFLQEHRGLSLASIGIIATAQSLGTTILTLYLGRISPSSAGMTIAQGLILLSYLFLLLVPWPPLIALAYFLRGGFSTLAVLATALGGRVLKPPSMGLGFGVLATLRTVALIPGPYIAGYLYSLRPEGPFLAAVVLIPLSAVVTLLAVKEEAPSQLGTSEPI